MRAQACAREVVSILRPPSGELELWKVEQSKRLWTVHNETYAFCAIDRTYEETEQSWSYRRKTYSMDQSSVMLIEPGELHVTQRLPTSDFRVLLVSPAKARALLGLRAGLPHFRTGQQAGGALVHRLKRACRAIGEQLSGTDTAEPLELDQRLTEFFADALQLAGEAPLALRATCQKGVKRAREFIDESYREELCLSQLSSLAGLSPFHLLRSFRREVGLPPLQYLRRVRLARAMALLRVGTAPSVVASAVGFRTQSGMTRSFNEAYGFTPGYFKGAKS